MALKFTTGIAQRVEFGDSTSLRVVTVALQYSAFPEITKIRVSSVLAQVNQFQETPPRERSSLSISQNTEFQETPPHLRTSFLVIQYVQRIKEPVVVTSIFPEVRGVTWDVHMKPTFSTKIAVHTSGKETRTSYWEDPVFDFDLVYDYLPNQRDTATTDLKKILGFFTSRKGSFDPFLYKMQEFNHETDCFLMTGDGNTVEATFMMDFNGAYTPVGQVTSGSEVLKISLAAIAVTPITDGSYASWSLAYPHLADITSHAFVNATHDPILPTGSLSGVDTTHYYFDAAAGKLYFAPSLAGLALGTFTYQATLVPSVDYTLTLPNTLVLTTAAPVDSTIAGSYDYLFIVRFLDDQADFDTFADQLWELQAISLRSVL